MARLQYGLNIQKKSTTAPTNSLTNKKRTIFDDDDDDDRDEQEAETTNTGVYGAQEIAVFDLDAAAPSKPVSSKSSTSLKPPSKPSTAAVPKHAQDLSTLRVLEKRKAEAEALDPSIYDYDAAYDALHAQSASRKEAERADALQRKPKYMENLLVAAEVRKRDQLRAEDRLRQKERETEGEEFKDTEEFVTEAYKKQQEEVKRLEEEERAREDREAEKRKGAGMSGFYRKVMEEEEKKHAEVVEAAKALAASGGAQGGEPKQEEENEEKTAAQMAKELNAKGARILINDEGQVTDKRQLLTAGLNVAPKRKVDGSIVGASPVAQRPVQRQDYRGRTEDDSKRAMRERQTRMIEAQLEQASKKAAEAEAEERAKMERAAKSKKTEGDVSSARERYLQRKRDAAAAKD